MNKFNYRLIFDRTLGCLRPVAEWVSSRTGVGSSLGEARSGVTLDGLGFQLRKYVLAMLLASFVPWSSIALAQSTLPNGGVVNKGAGSINVNGKTMNINQNSQKLGINWQGFNVGKGNTVNFIQPNAQAVALNRVVGNNRSEIFGAINANGKVFLVNQHGVLFGKNAQVNVGSMIATTKDISDDDFLSDKLIFEGNSVKEIINQGNLKSIDGYIVLAADIVKNEAGANIEAKNVQLVASQKVELSLDAHGQIKVQSTGSVVGALVENQGLISSDNGSVYLTARGKDMLLNNAINVEGLISSKSGTVVLDGGNNVDGGNVVLNGGTIDVSSASSSEKGGTVILNGNRVGVLGDSVIDASGVAGGGRVIIGGDLLEKVTDIFAVKIAKLTKLAKQARIKIGSSEGDGGFVETSGESVKISGTIDGKSKGKAGQWLIDPTDIVIKAGGNNNISASSAGNWMGNANSSGEIDVNAIENANADIVITTAGPNVTGGGNITVEDDIEIVNNSLTLIANMGVNVNAEIRAQGINITAGTSYNQTNATLNSGAEDIVITANNYTFRGNSELRGNNLSFGNTNDIDLGTGMDTLIFNLVGDLVIANNLTSAASNGGSIRQSGAGTLTLTANNTFTGNAYVIAGTLQVGNGTSGSISQTGAIINNADLVFDRNATTTNLSFDNDLGSVITGSGNTTIKTDGNLTINRRITNDKVTLFAGISKEAGDASGGSVTITEVITANTVNIFSGNNSALNTAALQANINISGNPANKTVTEKWYSAGAGYADLASDGQLNVFYRYSPVITVCGTATNRTYDGTDIVDVNYTSIVNTANLIDGDSFDVAQDAQGVMNSTHAGTNIIELTRNMTANTTAGSATAYRVSGYNITAVPINVIIAKRKVNITAVGSIKTYDGTNVSSNLATYGNNLMPDHSGFLKGDNISYAQIHNTTHAGNTTLTVKNISLTSNATYHSYDSDYNITVINNTSGTINKRVVNINAVTDTTKTYDGTNVSAVVAVLGDNSANHTGFLGGDNISYAQVHSDTHADDTTLTVSNVSLTSNATFNSVDSDYNISVTNISGEIDKRIVYVSAVYDVKTYDGTLVSATDATLSSANASERFLTGDSIDYTQLHDITHAGNTTLSIVDTSLTSNANGSYNSDYDVVTTDVAGTIKQKRLFGQFDSQSKVYDRGTSADGPTAESGITGWVAGDSRGEFTGVGTYNSKNAWEANKVNFSDVELTTLSSAIASLPGDYDASYIASADGKIFRKVGQVPAGENPRNYIEVEKPIDIANPVLSDVVANGFEVDSVASTPIDYETEIDDKSLSSVSFSGETTSKFNKNRSEIGCYEVRGFTGSAKVNSKCAITNEFTLQDFAKLNKEIAHSANLAPTTAQAGGGKLATADTPNVVQRNYQQTTDDNNPLIVNIDKNDWLTRNEEIIEAIKQQITIVAKMVATKEIDVKSITFTDFDNNGESSKMQNLISFSKSVFTKEGAPLPHITSKSYSSSNGAISECIGLDVVSKNQCLQKNSKLIRQASLNPKLIIN